MSMLRRSISWIERTIWGMRSIHPECSDSAAPDQSVAADVLLRQEPAEEEDEEDDEGGEEDDDVTTATRSERGTCLDFV